MEIIFVKSTVSEHKIQIPWNRLSKQTAESLVAELYKNDCITFKEARNLLNHTAWQETADILEQHGCELYYDRDDFEDDLETLGLKNITQIQ